MVFAIKMLLDYSYGLLNLIEFKYYHFNSLFLAESEFKNSNVGEKQLWIMSVMPVLKKTTTLAHIIWYRYWLCWQCNTMG